MEPLFLIFFCLIVGRDFQERHIKNERGISWYGGTSGGAVGHVVGDIYSPLGTDWHPLKHQAPPLNHTSSNFDLKPRHIIIERIL